MVLAGRSLSSLERRLVWIFGSPRSGSTWLLSLLTHPLVPADDAPSGVVRVQARAPGCAVPLNEPYVPHHLSPALPDEQLFNEALPAATLPELRGPSPNYFLSERFAAAWRPRLRGLVLARIEDQVRRVADEHR